MAMDTCACSEPQGGDISLPREDLWVQRRGAVSSEGLWEPRSVALHPKSPAERVAEALLCGGKL